MPKDPKKVEEFKAELNELLAKYKYQLAVGPVFIDKLGNKHIITVGEISAELQVKELDNEPTTDAE